MKKHLMPKGLKKTFILAALFISFAINPFNMYADDGAILIGNAGISEDTLSSVDVKNIFLGKKTTWGNGNKITFVTLKGGEVHKKFIRTYIKRNPSQFKNHWKKMLFTGKGVIPRSFSTDEQVIGYVSKNENVIGYISKSIAADGIKVISITN